MDTEDDCLDGHLLAAVEHVWENAEIDDPEDYKANCLAGWGQEELGLYLSGWGEDHIQIRKGNFLNGCNGTVDHYSNKKRAILLDDYFLVPIFLKGGKFIALSTKYCVSASNGSLATKKLGVEKQARNTELIINNLYNSTMYYVLKKDANRKGPQTTIGELLISLVKIDEAATVGRPTYAQKQEPAASSYQSGQSQNAQTG